LALKSICAIHNRLVQLSGIDLMHSWQANGGQGKHGFVQTAMCGTQILITLDQRFLTRNRFKIIDRRGHGGARLRHFRVMRQSWFQAQAHKKENTMQGAKFTAAIVAYDYMMAGNATVTFVSSKTGQRYTFKIRKPDEKKQDPRYKNNGNTYFVSLLSGPQNTTDFTYMGMISHNDFRLTKASKMNQESSPVKAFAWVWNHIINKQDIPEAVEIWHEGSCGRCGRKLTVPESIEAGIGPECAGKMPLHATERAVKDGWLSLRDTTNDWLEGATA